MASSVLNSDDGVISGTSGLKSVGGDDGTLNIQSNGTTAVTVNASGNVGIGTTSPTAKLSVDGSAVFNESGADVDFRVESDTNTHALFVDAENSLVGVNNSAPAVAFDVVGDVRSVGSTSTISKSQIGDSDANGGTVVNVVKRELFSANTLGATILTISGVAAARTAQVWEVIINSQASAVSTSRAQRSQKLAFMVTCADGNVPVVDIISGYGWADTLSTQPTGGARDPTAFNTAVTVDGSNNVIVTMDVNATGSAGSLAITVFAIGTGRRINLSNVS